MPSSLPLEFSPCQPDGLARTMSLLEWRRMSIFDDGEGVAVYENKKKSNSENRIESYARRNDIGWLVVYHLG